MNYHQLAKEIESIRPGNKYGVSRHIFNDIGISPERIMDNIKGSTYEFRFYSDPVTGDCIFERLLMPLEDGRQTYIEEDRQAFFFLGDDGCYHRR